MAHTSYQEARLSPTHQVGVANAATKPHLAELLLNRMCLDIDRAATERGQPDLETRGRIRDDTGVVAELITEAIRALLSVRLCTRRDQVALSPTPSVCLEARCRPAYLRRANEPSPRGGRT
ncbi:hypothetical protein GCM10022232_82850 [Streptomyces plumbiresistens]|uniref:Uncharacterized protein n=1 Tax=Streptomyces plumbiresistens TaxID=511811 RepID=A0ABP7TDT8_9ACTN